MLCPIEWLEDFINLPKNWTAASIAEDFLNHSAEVEGIINLCLTSLSTFSAAGAFFIYIAGSHLYRHVVVPFLS